MIEPQEGDRITKPLGEHGVGLYVYRRGKWELLYVDEIIPFDEAAFAKLVGKRLGEPLPGIKHVFQTTAGPSWIDKQFFEEVQRAADNPFCVAHEGVDFRSNPPSGCERFIGHFSERVGIADGAYQTAQPTSEPE